jgi:hypothetical protein
MAGELEQPAVLAGEKTGATGAFAWVMRRAVKVLPFRVDGALVPGVGVVETPPAGNTIRQPPPSDDAWPRRAI